MIYVSGNRLNYDVMLGIRHLYTLWLMEVYDSERNLNGGRFENYSKTEQQYSVTIDFGWSPGNELRRSLTGIIEWIAEHVQLKWNFTPEPHSVGHASFVFTFEDTTSAVIFKLVWG